MRAPITTLLALWLAACAVTVAGADAHAPGDAAIAVITAPGAVPASLDRATLAAVFRRRVQALPDGRPLVPVNLPAEDPLRVAFSLAVFSLEPSAMDAYWNERYFHGVSPPHVVASDEAMLRFVAATPGAIGYIAACRVDSRVSVLMTLPGPLPADCPATTAPAR